MKTIKLLSILFLSGIIFTSCSSSETPEPVNDEEIISIITITLTNAASTNDEVILNWVDSDEDGEPDTITSNAIFATNSTYNGTITLANQEESITPEIEAEKEDHQFFYSATNGIATFAYTDQDANGNPVGLSFTMTTADAGTGKIEVVLKHEPSKPNNGTATGAGGSADVKAEFEVTVQ